MEKQTKTILIGIAIVAALIFLVPKLGLFSTQTPQSKITYDANGKPLYLIQNPQIKSLGLFATYSGPKFTSFYTTFDTDTLRATWDACWSGLPDKLSYDYGDGHTGSSNGLASNGCKTVPHTYNTAGTFDYTFTLSESGFPDDTASGSIIVGGAGRICDYDGGTCKSSCSSSEVSEPQNNDCDSGLCCVPKAPTGDCSSITKDDSGASILNGGLCSSSVLNKLKCINANLYTCQDFQSGLGTCWYGGHTSSPSSGCSPCSTYTSQTDCSKLVDCTWNLNNNQCQSANSSSNEGCSQLLCPDGSCQPDNCCSHGASCPVNGANGDGLTMSEFLSADTGAIISSVSLNNNCNVREGYTVTSDSKFAAKIIPDILKEDCKSIVSALTLHFPIVSWGTSAIVCAVSDNAFQVLNTIAPLSVCYAEPNSGFEKYWNDALKIVYDMGIPRHYVIVVILFALVIIALIIVNLIPKK